MIPYCRDVLMHIGLSNEKLLCAPVKSRRRVAVQLSPLVPHRCARVFFAGPCTPVEPLSHATRTRGLLCRVFHVLLEVVDGGALHTVLLVDCLQLPGAHQGTLTEGRRGVSMVIQDDSGAVL